MFLENMQNSVGMRFIVGKENVRHQSDGARIAYFWEFCNLLLGKLYLFRYQSSPTWLLLSYIFFLNFWMCICVRVVFSFLQIVLQ